MILRSIQVEGWQCFAAPIRVGPFVNGLNIIHGPNGIGKSTLMMALARGLFDSHSVKGSDIKALRTWGRSLAPRVTIEFERRGHLYQLQKQFLNGESARLDRYEEAVFVPLAESRAADQQARALLSGEAPARGASDQRHWGLAQILWATQGSLAINELAAGTRASIQDALGAQIAGPGTELCEQRIASEYELYFTPKGKLKSGGNSSPLVALEKQLSDARTKRNQLLRQLDDFEAASRRITDLRQQVESAKHRDQDLQERLHRLREQALEFQRLQDQQALHHNELSGAEESYRHLCDQIELIRTTSAELDTAAQHLLGLQGDTSAHESLVQQCQQDVRLAEDALKRVRGRRDELVHARRLAQCAARYVVSRSELEDLDALLCRVESARADVEQLREVRQDLVAPDNETWLELTQVARERDDARLQLDAALITVHVQSASDLKLVVSRGEQPGPLQLTAGQDYQIKGAPDAAFQIPGVGSFRATGPVGDFETLRMRWESAVRRFDDLAAGFGTRDLSKLEKMKVQAQVSDEQLRQAEAKLEVLLNGETIESLRGRRARAESTLAEMYHEFPAWQLAAPEPADFARRADELEKELVSQTEAAETGLTHARQAWQHASESQVAHREKLQAAEASLVGIQLRLAALRKHGAADDEWTARLTEVAMRRDAAKGHLKRITERVEALGDDPAKALQIVEGEREAVRAATDQANKELNTSFGRLQQMVASAPYTALADTEEEISRIEEALARQQLQVDSTRLLYQTLQEEKRNLLQLVLDPIRRRANHMLQRIMGSGFSGVDFDDTLLPSGVVPKAADTPVSLGQISGGEREQVHFAVRMALADVAFQGERQLVVLDDVFTYTDAARLARIATILDDAADRFQIVLLSCHPERYRGLRNATFFDLESLRVAASQSPVAR